MLPRGVAADAAGGVSGAEGEADKRLRILVLEDNRGSADSLRLLLELSGHEVAVAYSGDDGARAAEQYRPDVVLCDIGLPGLDGYGVARRLRADPATAKARLIAVTAYGRDEDRRRSRDAGFEQHLVKPVSPEALQRALNGPAVPDRKGGLVPPSPEGHRLPEQRGLRRLVADGEVRRLQALPLGRQRL